MYLKFDIYFFVKIHNMIDPKTDTFSIFNYKKLYINYFINISNYGPEQLTHLQSNAHHSYKSTIAFVIVNTSRKDKPLIRRSSLLHRKDTNLALDSPRLSPIYPRYFRI